MPRPVRGLDFIKDDKLRNIAKQVIFDYKVHEKSSKGFNSSFLDPAQAKIICSQIDGEIESFGGRENAERRVLYSGKPIEDFFTIIEIYGASSEICHRDVLGSLLNSGLKREDLGDIVFCNGKIEFSILKDRINRLDAINQIKNEKVTFEIKESIYFDDSLEEDYIFEASVASFRLDVIVAACLNTSRSKIQPLIKADRVKLNYVVVSSLHTEVEVGDEISISGVGRFSLIEIGNLSRKGRTFVKLLRRG